MKVRVDKWGRDQIARRVDFHVRKCLECGFHRSDVAIEHRNIDANPAIRQVGIANN